jgi:GNAT superfamily N-acetyltransferase
MYSLQVTDNASADELRVIHDGLNQYNHDFAPEHAFRPLHVLLRDEAGAPVGGLTGGTFWGWLHIELLWLPEAARRQDLGTRIMAAAEEEARRRGCHHAYVDTLSFQALPFYLKLGFVEWGRLKDFPVGHTRYFLRKAIAGADQGSEGDQGSKGRGAPGTEGQGDDS